MPTKVIASSLILLNLRTDVLGELFVGSLLRVLEITESSDLIQEISGCLWRAKLEAAKVHLIFFDYLTIYCF